MRACAAAPDPMVAVVAIFTKMGWSRHFYFFYISNYVPHSTKFTDHRRVPPMAQKRQL